MDKEDCMCPICMSIYIEPVTMPCKHSLCMPCYKQTVEKANLCCPICRLRISVWARKATKSNTLVDKDKWNAIKKAFPEKVQNRLEGNESFDDALDDSEDYKTKLRRLKELSKPGEIRQEYEAALQKLQQEQEEKAKREEEASALLIKALQEEEAKEMEKMREDVCKRDREIAEQLDQSFIIDMETEAVNVSMSSGTNKTESKAITNVTRKGKAKQVKPPDNSNMTLTTFFSPVSRDKDVSAGTVWKKDSMGGKLCNNSVTSNQDKFSHEHPQRLLLSEVKSDKEVSLFKSKLNGLSSPMEFHQNKIESVQNFEVDIKNIDKFKLAPELLEKNLAPELPVKNVIFPSKVKTSHLVETITSNTLLVDYSHLSESSKNLTNETKHTKPGYNATDCRPYSTNLSNHLAKTSANGDLVIETGSKISKTCMASCLESTSSDLIPLQASDMKNFDKISGVPENSSTLKHHLAKTDGQDDPDVIKSSSVISDQNSSVAVKSSSANNKCSGLFPDLDGDYALFLTDQTILANFTASSVNNKCNTPSLDLDFKNCFRQLDNPGLKSNKSTFISHRNDSEQNALGQKTSVTKFSKHEKINRCSKDVEITMFSKDKEINRFSKDAEIELSESDKNLVNNNRIVCSFNATHCNNTQEEINDTTENLTQSENEICANQDKKDISSERLTCVLGSGESENVKIDKLNVISDGKNTVFVSKDVNNTKNNTNESSVTIIDNNCNNFLSLCLNNSEAYEDPSVLGLSNADLKCNAEKENTEINNAKHKVVKTYSTVLSKKRIKSKGPLSKNSSTSYLLNKGIKEVSVSITPWCISKRPSSESEEVTYNSRNDIISASCSYSGHSNIKIDASQNSKRKLSASSDDERPCDFALIKSSNIGKGETVTDSHRCNFYERSTTKDYKTSKNNSNTPCTSVDVLCSGEADQSGMSQEEKDHLLALRLQEMYTELDKRNISVERFKGSKDQYQLRKKQKRN